MLKNILWICLVTCGFTTYLNGQAFGGNKWSQQWLQYDNDKIRVIFPEGFEDQAAGVFSLLDYLNQNKRESIGLKTDKISLVLNNLTNISNGYVGLAPFKSEFFTTPTQNSFTLGSLPWLDLLTLHEYRHVLQFSNGKRGLSKILSVLFGQSAYAGSINVAVPDWYFEGDAVMAETAMSSQGRGRIPHFLRAYKAYESEGRRFSYQKVRNGSYKDFIPDHYRSGFMMNKFGADQYGPTFWGEVLADAGAYKGLLYPFSSAIKSRSGHTTTTLYQATMDHYKSTWSSNEPTETIGEELISTNDKVFTNYRFPAYDERGNLYYVKGSLNNINELWTTFEQKTKKLFALGTSNDIYLDINGDKVSWSELRYHPSRGNINYSVAMSFDVKTGVKHQVSFQTRYTSPTAHPDGKVMAVVDINQFGNTQLKLISTRDGLVIDSLANNQNYYITYPKWSIDANQIYFSARDQKGRMAICQQSINSGKVSVISPWTYHPIGIPYVTESHVYYSRSDADAEHIYRVSISDGMEELVIQSQFGAYQPSINGEEIIYSAYTANGLRLMISEIKPSPSKLPIENPKVDKTYAAYGGSVLSSTPKSSTAPKKYGRLDKAINLHSWGLTADDQSGSILLQSDNVLNSISLSGGLQYLFDDQRSIWTAGATFGFIYPNLTTRYTQEAREVIVTVDDQPEKINFDDYNISFGLEAPLNLSAGPYIRSLLPHFAIERRLFRGPRIEDLNFTSQRLGLIFLNRRLKAHREVLAINSQFVNLSYQGTIDDREGSQFDLESEFTFPGLMKAHALRVELDYNKQSGGLFSNRFDEARGYVEINAEKSFRLGINYHLPILYPDFGIGGLAYLKRIQANLFYDFSNLASGENTLDRNSTGIEVLFDTNFLNTLPVTLGVRYAHAIDIKDNVIEFFIPFYRF